MFKKVAPYIGEYNIPSHERRICRLMKVPLILCFLVIRFFMENRMDQRKCLLIGLACLLSVALEAVLEHITNVLQSSAGYKVFADLRLRLGDHLRKLPR